MIQSKLCPCHSGKPYENCCQKYHKGISPENALLLMRSRFSAYALGLADYIIETTHKKNPHFFDNKTQWKQQLILFSKQVDFQNLEIHETLLNEKESFVTFTAYLYKDKSELTFTEKSRFLKEGSLWKYVDGKIAKGRLSAEEMNERI